LLRLNLDGSTGDVMVGENKMIFYVAAAARADDLIVNAGQHRNGLVSVVTRLIGGST